MKVKIHNKSVLDITEADTLALPIDASAPRLEGNVARQFMKRIGVTQLDECFAPPPYYPFNGDCHWSNVAVFGDKTHFHYICALGMLSHEPGANHAGYIESAFDRMLGFAHMDPGFGEDIACPVLRGGHRLKFVDAVFLMLSVIERNKQDATVHIAVEAPEDFGILRDIVR
jgi:hypothetical protein